MEFYDVVRQFENEFNVMAIEINEKDFTIDYDDFIDEDMEFYLDLECDGYDVEYSFEVDDGIKICRFKIIKKKFELTEKRQNYLDNVAINIENQLAEMLLDDDEISYVCDEIKNRCG